MAVNGDVHVAARSVQVPGPKGRILYINLGTRQCGENGRAPQNSPEVMMCELQLSIILFIDLPGSGEDEIHKELQRYESKQDHNHCRPEHWQNRHRWSIL